MLTRLALPSRSMALAGSRPYHPFQMKPRVWPPPSSKIWSTVQRWGVAGGWKGVSYIAPLAKRILMSFISCNYYFFKNTLRVIFQM